MSGWMRDPVQYELWQIIYAEHYRRFAAAYGLESFSVDEGDD